MTSAIPFRPPRPRLPVRFASLGLAPWLVAASAAQSSDHLRYVLKGAPGDRLGSALSVCGDVDRDGCADFVIGEPRASVNGLHSGRVRVHSGSDARVLLTIAGDAAQDYVGSAVAGAGDVDRDGFADFLVGAPGADNAGVDAGRARIHSGRDGRVLWTFDGANAGDQLGTSVAGIGDVNGDGVPDCALGAPKAAHAGPLAGSAFVRSGQDGSLLRASHGGAAGDEFGTWVGAAGDVDRDGAPDLIVGAPLANGRSGSVRVVSARDGRVLWTFGGGPGAEFGSCASGAGDVDRDGYPDLVVGAWSDDQPQLDCGSVTVFSGRDGRTLRTVTGGPNDHLGWRVAGVGDVDRDGFVDVMGGKGWYFSAADQGYARVWSGRDGSVLRTFPGFQVGGGEDLTGDGVPDLITGAWQLDREAGTAWVFSGAAQTLVATPQALPASTGGNQSLRVQAGTTHGGATYWLLGSLSGTRPGVRVLGFDLPLNPDPYTALTLTPLPPPVFTGFQGTLDATGGANATFAVPPGLPPATFHHALAVVDASGLRFVGNAVSLRLD